MHALQKKAILALLGMVESAVREIRMVLADSANVSADTTAPAHAEGGYVQHVETPRSPHDMSLSDEEDDTLEEMMEKHRLDLLGASQNMADKFYRDAAPPSLGGFFDEES